MRHKLYSKAIFFALLAFAIPSAFAQMPQPFSADFATTTHNGEKMTGKWYFSAPKMRIDMNSMSGRDQGPMAGPVSMIIDGASQTSYMVMHGPHMYMEFHGQQQGGQSPAMNQLARLRPGADPCAGDPNWSCTKLGTETVNGRSCEKWKVADKRSGKNSTMWVDQKLRFPIRVQDSEGTTMDMTNIKEGAQDASLFKVPAGYQPFNPAAFGGRRPQK